ncbi:hypothetical protein DL766_002416 [Monosporascus sp. MC13-8B]|uniref:Ketoreductase domain-containing protein n=1 Tax=Monosporascus cannonballus TaxID=155416 RepID=A0ABY0HER1_9PEZI|nr:hypothetical protein DL762_001997 [Monosporascus cannonballus]RYO97121.1 hypothetical protein DL763_002911 [Monosporascus cannonballus]RYP35683.1 hypothetical protein DL766_002416 [Monosporascus sp. MC13-8B]
MRIFLRNTTFPAFDFSSLFFYQDPFYPNILPERFEETLELCLSGQIEPLPLTVYKAANISQAYRYFSTKDRVGKVVVTIEDADNRVSVKGSRYKAIFDPAKIYLLGVRKFVFLGRSGCDKSSAKRLVERMESMGANVTVKAVRGDVSNTADATAAVKTCQTVGVIGGVVQAAMGLQEALFQRMSNEAWHTAIQAKWAGSWNLHNALAVDGRDKKLDFFHLTSSVSGSVGTAAESNYCAANGFLDAFARWRRQQGKPAVSIGLGMISEVGYLHENPEIEAILLRKGIQPLNEDGFLQVVDLGIAEDIHFVADACGNAGQPNTGERSAKGAVIANILTGLEPFRLPALTADQESGGAAQVCSLPGGGLASAPWLKPLSATVAASLLSGVDAGSLQEAVLRLVGKRFSSLVWTPLDNVDNHKPLAHFRRDSMIAANSTPGPGIL